MADPSEALAGRALLALAGLLALSCCGGDGAVGGAGADVGAALDARHDGPVADATPPCAPGQRRPEGGCCPAGEAWLAGADACGAVGPPGCAAALFDPAVPCLPIWCWDLRTWDGDAACDAPSEACRVVGRACTDDELAVDRGCRAGAWPDLAAGGGCVQAGAPGATGPEGPLPPVVTPRWCRDAACPDPTAEGCSVIGRACRADELAAAAGCPAGTWPDPAFDGACTPAGAWSGTPSALIPSDPLADPPPEATPRWCWDHLTADGAACAPGAADCQLTPRRCRRAELDAGAGCPAGTGPPDPDVAGPWACVEAGAGFVCPPGFVAAEPDAEGAVLCSPDPAACGPFPYGGVSDAPDRRFVLAEADGPGDGTRGDPFKTIAAALVDLPFGGTIVIGPGDYPESLRFGAPVALHGRCAADVTISGDGVEPTIQVASGLAGVSLAGLTVTGSQPLLEVEEGASVTGRRLALVAPSDKAAILEPSSSVSLHETWVEGDVGGGAKGGGALSAEGGAQLFLDTVAIGYAHQGAIDIGTGSRLVARGLRIAQVRGHDSWGDGIVVRGKTSARLSRVTLAGIDRRGMKLLTSTVSAHLLRLDRAQPIAREGPAIDCWGTTLRLTGSLIDTRWGLALAATSDSTEVVAAGLVIEGADLPEEPPSLYAMSVSQGASVTLTAVQLRDGYPVGISVGGEGTRLVAEELVVGGARRSPSIEALIYSEVTLRASRLGKLISVAAYAHVEAEGVLVDAPNEAFRWGGCQVNQATLQLVGSRLHRCRGSGLRVGKESSADVVGVVIDGTRPFEAALLPGASLGGGDVGEALRVTDDGQIRVTASHLVDQVYGGAVARGGQASITARDLVIEGTAALQSGGAGIILRYGARFDGVDVRVSRSASVGVWLDDGSTIRLERTLVDDVEQGGVGGVGVALRRGSRGTLIGVTIADAHLAGVLVDPAPATLSATGVVVRGTAPWHDFLGFGYEVLQGSVAEVQGGYVVGNHFAGMLASVDARLDATGVIVTDTYPAILLEAFGVGIGATGGATLNVVSSVIRGNRSSGVSLHDGVARLDGCVIEDTLLTGYLEPGGGTPVEFADGLLAFHSDISVERSLLRTNARAGILLDGCEGVTLRATVSSGNGFGLVAQGGTTFSVEEAVFSGNDRARCDDAFCLSVPDPPELFAPP